MTAWLVHAFTATGAVLAYMAVEATIAGDTRRAFLWLVVATLVDAVDGALARLARVKERTPQFNGARLDDIVDYLTFVFVPVFILRHDGLLPAGASGLAVASAVLLSSAYGFSREDAKTPDHFFTGFPSVLEHRRGLHGRHPARAGDKRRDPVWAGGAGVRAHRVHLPITHAALAAGNRGAGTAMVDRDGGHHLDATARARSGWCRCRCCTRSTTSGSRSSCTSSEPPSPRGRRPRPPCERSETPAFAKAQWRAARLLAPEVVDRRAGVRDVGA